MKSRIQDLSTKIGQEDFWEDPKAARKATQEKSRLEKELQKWEDIGRRFDNLTAAMELLHEHEDSSLLLEIKNSLADLKEQLSRIEREKQDYF